MAYHIYFRILGYVVTMALHIGNIVVMAQPRAKHIPIDPRVKVYAELQARFFTCWTFFLQIVFAFSGLVCDILILKNSGNENYKLPKYLRGFRNTMFAAILWPCTWLVSTFFWSLYLYDRSLIYPTFVDTFLTSTSNHIMHTVIVPIVLWEVVFQPRYVPKSHSRYLLHLVFHLALYFSVFMYTYFERSIWIYPIFEKLYGTSYFYIVILSLLLLCIGFYYAQWYLTVKIWGRLEKEKNKIKIH
ncbi:androgen-dependent TFPI-regulating protein-like [Galleria mellonella]|uniref:Androgen-dependent TFPI-regulating protein-like n=1 Tax=Galleria mellonella TaxID=7137 RepID=A0A6J1WLB9_GALME|nr:androgen-dependent TFPI-regulating protein-like [Galleria mellonella]